MLPNKFDISFYILSCIFFCGVFLRLFFIFTQPLWLDEQFSLYFSQRYSTTELIYTFNHDIHPGGYYLLLKITTYITQSVAMLRLLTAFIPEVIAFGLMLKTVQTVLKKIEIQNVVKKYNNHRNAYCILAFLYFLNPLVIDQSWQLRMYGMVLLLSSASVLALVYFYLHLQKKHAITLILLLLVGISFNYSFIGLALVLFSSLIYILDKPKWLKAIFSGIFFVGIVGWFLILSGFNSRSQLEYASWISQPTVKIASGVYLTVLGLSSNIHGFTKNINLAGSVLEYSTLILITLFIYQLINKVKTKEHKVKIIFSLLISTAFLFSGIILVLSLTLPFLSNRIFFHHFVPNISLFLPRTHIVILPLFWVALSMLLYNLRFYLLFKSKKKVLSFMLVAMIITYVTTLGQIHSNRLTAHDRHQSIIEKANAYNLILPDWVHYLSIDQPHILVKNYFVTINDSVKKSKQIENSALSSLNISQNKVKKSELNVCDHLKTESLIIFTQFYSSDEINELESIIKTCCQNEYTFQDDVLKCF
jgi:hypothetical protein